MASQISTQPTTTQRIPPISAHDTVLAVDLGKTNCRVRVTGRDGVLAEATGAGAPGVADFHGDEASFDAIMGTVQKLDAAVRARITHCGIGAAGVHVAPEAAGSLCRRLRDALGVPVAIITDALTAHLGAFGGGEGAVLIAGTGAIAFGLGNDRIIRQVDGWGPWLGDNGSGRWIGQHGLQSALHHYDGRGAATSLTEAAVTAAGSAARLPVWVAETGETVRRIASFAPTVLDHAQAGDAIASDIAHRAAAALGDTAAAAARPHDLAVAVVGGLTGHPYFADLVTRSIAIQGLHTVAPLGDALTGAAVIALDSSLPHERHVIRDR